MAVLAVLFLVVLCVYSYFNFTEKQYARLPDYFKDPGKYVMTSAVLRGQLVNLTDFGFFFRSDDKVISVVYEGVIRQPVLGTVNVYGSYADGFFAADRVDILDYNKLKYFVSVLGLLVVIFFIVRERNA